MKATGIGLAIAGIIAVVVAILLPLVFVPNAAFSDINKTNSTTTANVTGKILNDQKFRATPTDPYEDVTLTATRQTVANSQAMSESGAIENDAAVFDTVNSVVRQDNQQELFKTAATYAFNRETSKLINCCNANINGDTAIDFQGIMPLKFPFGVTQKDLELFDPILKKPMPVTFQQTTENFDMELYSFNQGIVPTQVPGDPYLTLPQPQAQILVELIAPGVAETVAAIPADQEVPFYQYYSVANDYLVEPATGQIVSGTFHTISTLRVPGNDTDVIIVSDLVSASSDAEQRAATIKSERDSLIFGSVTLPLILGIVGVVAVIIGVVLWFLSSRRDTPEELEGDAADDADDALNV